jgi:CRISPR-associated protein Cas2
MNQERFNQYRIMWLMVFFDLPVLTKKQRKQAAKFRKDLIKGGFIMFQLSIYVRHCPSPENAEVHVRRVKSYIPDQGHVCIFRITDKQFGMIEIFNSGKAAQPKDVPQQLELF